MISIITGSTGFVGQNLIGYLSEFGLSHLPLTRLELAAENYLKLDEGYAVIHLAGKAHDVKDTSAPEEYYKVNFELTRRLYEAFLLSDCTKFIYISSIKAAADYSDEPINEGYIANPKTHYGRSKLMAEEYLQNQALPEGKSCYILRPCMIHGPGNKGNLSLLYKLISSGLPYPLASFENGRSFLSIENLCFAISKLVTRNDIPSGIYHLADDHTLSTNELIRLIAKTCGRNPLLWRIHPSLIKLLGKIGDTLKLPFNSGTINKLTQNLIVDNSKFRNALGEQLPVDVRDGITTTIRWFNNPK